MPQKISKWIGDYVSYAADDVTWLLKRLLMRCHDVVLDAGAALAAVECDWATAPFRIVLRYLRHVHLELETKFSLHTWPVTTVLERVYIWQYSIKCFTFQQVGRGGMINFSWSRKSEVLLNTAIMIFLKQSFHFMNVKMTFYDGKSLSWDLFGRFKFCFL